MTSDDMAFLYGNVTLDVMHPVLKAQHVSMHTDDAIVEKVSKPTFDPP